MTLEEALISVWRQTLEENSNLVELGGKRFAVRRTQRDRLRQVDFEFEGRALRGVEQNPQTRSRWAELARKGQKVMQFLSAGRYLANVANGTLTLYRKSAAAPPDKNTDKKAAAAAASRPTAAHKS
jgi:hypothetical protein